MTPTQRSEPRRSEPTLGAAAPIAAPPAILYRPLVPTYDLASVELPLLTGTPLSLFASVLESAALRPLLMGRLLRDAGVEKVRGLVLEREPTSVPLSRDHSAAGATPLPPLSAVRGPEAVHGPLEPPLARARDFFDAYRDGRATPDQIAERLITAIARSNGSTIRLGAVLASDAEDLRVQARASTARWQAGRPLGPLDGVPVGIKDELDQTGYPTTVGTSFWGQAPARVDATVVARLRAAGALLFGKLNMHEIGINPDGSNMNHGLVRNPHDLARDTGGSSSGSAAAVAAGLCPIAIGADGGGSVRIPAALCGVAGLKATYGRISEHGAAPLCWTVAHVGPLAASVEDLALAYAVIAGPDARDPWSQSQPAPSLEGFGSADVKGLRVGVYRPYFEHAQPDVVARCQDGLRALEAAGARVVEVTLHDLDASRIAHAVTILTEMATAVDRHGPDAPFSVSTRVNLAIGRAFSASDYVKAQQIRTAAIADLAAALRVADVIATPTTARTAPRIPVEGAREGWSNLTSVTEVMRYAFLGNLTGFPAVTVPVGVDGKSLPVGLQLMGRPWAEHVLLRAAAVVEARLAPRRAPLRFDLLA